MRRTRFTTPIRCGKTLDTFALVRSFARHRVKSRMNTARLTALVIPSLYLYTTGGAPRLGFLPPPAPAAFPPRPPIAAARRFAASCLFRSVFCFDASRPGGAASPARGWTPPPCESPPREPRAPASAERSRGASDAAARTTRPTRRTAYRDVWRARTPWRLRRIRGRTSAPPNPAPRIPGRPRRIRTRDRRAGRGRAAPGARLATHRRIGSPRRGVREPRVGHGADGGA